MSAELSSSSATTPAGTPPAHSEAEVASFSRQVVRREAAASSSKRKPRATEQDSPFVAAPSSSSPPASSSGSGRARRNRHRSGSGNGTAAPPSLPSFSANRRGGAASAQSVAEAAAPGYHSPTQSRPAVAAAARADPEWTVHQSRSTGMLYFFSSVTGATQWVEPPDFDGRYEPWMVPIALRTAQATGQEPSVALRRDAKSLAALERSSEHDEEDEEDGDRKNGGEHSATATDEAESEVGGLARPSTAVVEQADGQDATQQRDDVAQLPVASSAQSGGTSKRVVADVPLVDLSHLGPDDAWRQHVTDDGLVYYSNAVTQATTWDRPRCLGPLVLDDDAEVVVMVGDAVAHVHEAEDGEHAAEASSGKQTTLPSTEAPASNATLNDSSSQAAAAEPAAGPTKSELASHSDAAPGSEQMPELFHWSYRGKNGWVSATDPDGYVYYIHEPSQRTQWERPTDF